MADINEDAAAPRSTFDVSQYRFSCPPVGEALRALTPRYPWGRPSWCWISVCDIVSPMLLSLPWILTLDTYRKSNEPSYSSTSEITQCVHRDVAMHNQACGPDLDPGRNHFERRFVPYPVASPTQEAIVTLKIPNLVIRAIFRLRRRSSS